MKEDSMHKMKRRECSLGAVTRTFSVAMLLHISIVGFAQNSGALPPPLHRLVKQGNNFVDASTSTSLQTNGNITTATDRYGTPGGALKFVGKGARVMVPITEAEGRDHAVKTVSFWTFIESVSDTSIPSDWAAWLDAAEDAESIYNYMDNDTITEGMAKNKLTFGINRVIEKKKIINIPFGIYGIISPLFLTRQAGIT